MFHLQAIIFHSSPSRGGSLFSVLPSRQAKPHVLARARFNVNSAASFDDAEGPGSGRRQLPAPFEIHATQQPSSDSFPLYSAEEMEELFPEWIHASMPTVVVNDPERPGVTALRNGEGPSTGLRRRPSFATPRAEGGVGVVPYPISATGPADLQMWLQRDLATKRKISPLL